MKLKHDFLGFFWVIASESCGNIRLSRECGWAQSAIV
jgi:hypothetical protein